MEMFLAILLMIAILIIWFIKKQQSKIRIIELKEQLKKEYIRSNDKDTFFLVHKISAESFMKTRQVTGINMLFDGKYTAEELLQALKELESELK